MSEPIEQAIQDIASKHGVLLSKDDPILILHTMNERLLEENRKAQEKLLAEFKKEMECIVSIWKNEAKEKAEKVLNAALVSSKEVVAKLLQDSAYEFKHAITLILNEKTRSLNFMGKEKNESWFMLLLSIMIVSLIFLCFLLFYIK